MWGRPVHATRMKFSSSPRVASSPRGSLPSPKPRKSETPQPTRKTAPPNKTTTDTSSTSGGHSYEDLLYQQLIQLRELLLRATTAKKNGNPDPDMEFYDSRILRKVTNQEKAN